MNNRRPLGRSPISISAIGLGCWQFSEGHGLAGGYWPARARKVARQLSGGADADDEDDDPTQPCAEHRGLLRTAPNP